MTFKVSDTVLVKSYEDLIKLDNIRIANKDFSDAVVKDSFVGLMHNCCNKIFIIKAIGKPLIPNAIILENMENYNFYERWLIPINKKTAKVLFNE